MSLGKQMRKIRKKRNMTQTEVGNLLGCTKSVICHYEKDTYPPKIDRFFKYIEVMQLTDSEKSELCSCNKNVTA